MHSNFFWIIKIPYFEDIVVDTADTLIQSVSLKEKNK